jgi:hypothetical protein
MKKIYVCTLLLSLVAGQAFSQRIAVGGKIADRTFSFTNNRQAADTLEGTFDWNTLISSEIDGFEGFVSGNNAFGDLAKAQVYVAGTDSVNVVGLIIIFDGKDLQSGDQNSQVVAHVYRLDGTGMDGNNQLSAPGTSAASKNISAEDIDVTETGLNAVTFDNPVRVAGTFAVGVDFSALADGDFAGLLMSGDDDLDEMQHQNRSWEKWSDQVWYTMSNGDGTDAWGFDVAFAIFPIIEGATVSIFNYENNRFKVYQNIPNPFSTKTNIIYELFEPADVTIEVTDISGRTVIARNEGFKSSGVLRSTFDATDFPAGIYYYSLRIGEQSVTKKMVVVK